MLNLRHPSQPSNFGFADAEFGYMNLEVSHVLAGEQNFEGYWYSSHATDDYQSPLCQRRGTIPYFFQKVSLMRVYIFL